MMGLIYYKFKVKSTSTTISGRRIDTQPPAAGNVGAELSPDALWKELFPSRPAPFFTTTAAQHYGDLRIHLERQGAPIGSLDLLIAAHALSFDCILVTNNEREFSRIPDLQIENWAG
jgi:predicted nucleic acid-binding protein